MKKILFFAAIAAMTLSMASCQKEGGVSDNTFKTGTKLIRFGFASSTRAFTEATADGVQADENGFKVAGVLSDNSVSFNEAAKWSAADNFYRTDNDYYYPDAPATISFFAAYPAATEIAVAEGVASIAYTQNPDTDLIVAKKADVAAQGSSVALEFDHALSQVAVTCTGKDAGAVYKIKSVTLKGFADGTYTYADGKMVGGTAMEAADSFFASEDGEELTSAKQEIGAVRSYIPGLVQVTVNWACYDKTGKFLAEYTKSTCIDEADPDFEDKAIVLSQGDKNTINLTLPNSGVEKITFTISVNPWVSKEIDREL